MKFEAAASDLSAALDLVAFGLVDRVKIPSFSAIKIEAGDAAVALTCTVMSYCLTVTTPVNVIEPGVAAPPGRQFAALVGNMIGATRVSLAGDSVCIAGGRSRYSLPSVPIADLPSPLSIGEPAGDALELDRVEFLRTIETAEFAIARGPERHYLRGLHLHGDGDDTLAVVATDGQRLVRTILASSGAPPKLTLPLESATLLARLLRKAKAERVELRSTKNLLTAVCAPFEFCSKLIDATYPNYRPLISNELKATCEVDRDDLIAALQRLDAVADPTWRPAIAVIAWGDNQLALSLDDDDDTAADAIAADTNGHCKTAAQVGRLLELLRHLDGDRVRLGSTDPGAPIVFTAAGDGSPVFLQAPCSMPTKSTKREEADPAPDIQQRKTKRAFR
jgi:DNA polymerase-3 subunit beta